MEESMRKLVLSLVLLAVAVAPALAQDPVKVDPTHYSVMTENAKVRVLNIKYGPHEKSVMHWHPDAVAVFLNDATIRFTLPDGKTQDVTGKAGDAITTPAGKHLPENMGDQEARVILVELKSPKAKSHPAAAKK
jgi:quercetin dioxygenase-like cupin family protein